MTWSWENDKSEKTSNGRNYKNWKFIINVYVGFTSLFHNALFVDIGIVSTISITISIRLVTFVEIYTSNAQVML